MGLYFLLLIIIFIFVPLAIVGTVVFFLLKTKKKKDSFESICETVTFNPSDVSADTLMNYLSNNKSIIDVIYRDRLRAVWLIFNASPNVTTPKKVQLRNFLTVKGMTLNPADAQIIDNYGKNQY